MDNQRKDHIDPKRALKGTAPNNYWPIMCIPLMWKILTAQIREEIYDSLTSHGFFPKEEKGCCKKKPEAQKSYSTAHPQREQDKKEKSSYEPDWQQKGISYGPVKLDKKTT